MGKRSNFERVPRDYYPTPIHAVEPLIPHLPYSFKYIEPCAGDGRLMEHLTKLTDGMAECILALDIEPKADHIIKGDDLHFHGASEFDTEILTITQKPLPGDEFVILELSEIIRPHLNVENGTYQEFLHQALNNNRTYFKWVQLESTIT